MSQRRSILLALLAGILLLVFFSRQPEQMQDARRKLDNVLGPSSSEHLPDLSQEAAPPRSLGNFFGFNIPMPDTGVDVQETPTAYLLKVPLAQASDADSIRLQVRPHRIEITGQSGRRQGGASVSSSFMQSFTTRQEVLPGKVSRKTESHGDAQTLVITIPKKTPGTVSSPPASPFNQSGTEAEPMPAPDSTPSLDNDTSDPNHVVI